MTARLPGSFYWAMGALTTLLLGLWLVPMGDTRRGDPLPPNAQVVQSPPLAGGWPKTEPIIVVVATAPPTGTPTAPPWTPVPTAPVAKVKTPGPPPCTRTPVPGARCDVLAYQQSLTAPTATPVLCDIVLQTPNPYNAMPGRYCWWPTIPPTIPPTPTTTRGAPTSAPLPPPAGDDR